MKVYYRFHSSVLSRRQEAISASMRAFLLCQRRGVPPARAEIALSLSLNENFQWPITKFMLRIFIADASRAGVYIVILQYYEGVMYRRNIAVGEVEV